MPNRFVVWAAAVLMAAAMTASVWAAPQAKKYQVTGPVVKMDEGKVTVQKGDELWEVVTDKDTKVTGTLAVGSKVTIEYKMVATTVTVKAAGAKEEAAK